MDNSFFIAFAKIPTINKTDKRDADINVFLYFCPVKLSIIIPIYNTVSVVGRCVSSVASQPCSDYEIILVDDGSTDQSGTIADGMACRDKRIRAYHKANGGLSDARNYGIEQATGDYIAFVDSDDELAPDTLPKLMSIITKHPEYDILEYSVVERFGSDREHSFKPKDTVFNDCLEWLSMYGFEHCWAWNKIFKRELFDDVKFRVGRLYEDALLIGDILHKKPVIAMTSEGTYLYHWNENGIVAKSNLMTLLEIQVDIVREMNIDTRQKKWHRLYFDMLANQLHAYRQSGNIILWSQHITIKKYNGWGDCLKAVLLNVFGMEKTCKIAKLLYRMR